MIKLNNFPYIYFINHLIYHVNFFSRNHGAKPMQWSGYMVGSGKTQRLLLVNASYLVILTMRVSWCVLFIICYDRHNESQKTSFLKGPTKKKDIHLYLYLSHARKRKRQFRWKAYPHELISTSSKRLYKYLHQGTLTFVQI